MGLIEFLDNFPEAEDQPLSYAALSQLSGISRPEATELSLTWEEWTEARRLELIERLTGLQEDHNDLEFEVVFKEGLRLDDPRGRVLSLLGLSESHDRTLVATFALILRNDPDRRVRESAARASAGLASLAAQGRLTERDSSLLCATLHEALDNEDETIEVKRRALETIGFFGRVDAERHIDRLSSDVDPATLRSTLIAVARTSDPHWLPLATLHLDHFDAGVRYEAVAAFGEIGVEEDAQRLEPPLDDQDLAVQEAAIKALGLLGGPEAAVLLSRAMKSPEPAIVAAATETLNMLTAEDGMLEVAPPDDDLAGVVYGPGMRPAGDPSDDEYSSAEREGWSHLFENGANIKDNNGLG